MTFQSPAVSHDQAVIQQLTSDLGLLVDAADVIEQDLREDLVEEIPESFRLQPVKERTKTLPEMQSLVLLHRHNSESMLLFKNLQQFKKLLNR